ncbi:MAG: hypothetical protein Q9220_006059 [cf. Caloplaca sp. 1 TL-2023]
MPTPCRLPPIAQLLGEQHAEIKAILATIDQPLQTGAPAAVATVLEIEVSRTMLTLAQGQQQLTPPLSPDRVRHLREESANIEYCYPELKAPTIAASDNAVANVQTTTPERSASSVTIPSSTRAPGCTQEDHDRALMRKVFENSLASHLRSGKGYVSGRKAFRTDNTEFCEKDPKPPSGKHPVELEKLSFEDMQLRGAPVMRTPDYARREEIKEDKKQEKKKKEEEEKKRKREEEEEQDGRNVNQSRKRRAAIKGKFAAPVVNDDTEDEAEAEPDISNITGIYDADDVPRDNDNDDDRMQVETSTPTLAASSPSPDDNDNDLYDVSPRFRHRVIPPAPATGFRPSALVAAATNSSFAAVNQHLPLPNPYAPTARTSTANIPQRTYTPNAYAPTAAPTATISTRASIPTPPKGLAGTGMTRAGIEAAIANSPLAGKVTTSAPTAPKAPAPKKRSNSGGSSSSGSKKRKAQEVGEGEEEREVVTRSGRVVKKKERMDL